jgi:hypothetical protein
MSISTMADNATLRLGGAEASAPDATAAAATAAATAAAAVSSGVTVDKATEQGKQAAAAATQTSQPSTAPPGPLSQLVKFIPTETITLYIAVLGALGDVKVPTGRKLSDADFTSRWAWVWALLAVTILLTLGLSYRSQKNATGNTRFKFPIFEVLASGTAFVVWSLSLPSTPLRDIGGYDYNVWNSVIILGGTLAIATTAHVFGKSVTWQKVLET